MIKDLTRSMEDFLSTKILKGDDQFVSVPRAC